MLLTYAGISAEAPGTFEVQSGPWKLLKIAAPPLKQPRICSTTDLPEKYSSNITASSDRLLDHSPRFMLLISTKTATNELSQNDR
jgi:hypothetical protein